MANATTADFRNGMVIRYNNDLYIVTEFHHVSPGNWRAFVRTNLKNVRTGRVVEVRFRAGEEIEEVRVEHQNWQFLYVDGEDYVFMNTETYDQQPIPKEQIGDVIRFLKEGDTIEALVDGDTIIALGCSRKGLEEEFRSVELAAEHHSDWGMGEENGPIYLCRGVKTPLKELWPSLKHWD